MNWTRLRGFPWLDTRAQFVAGTPPQGNLLDLGSSDGETLGHIAELRPDLHLFAVDIAGAPVRYPPGCEFVRADLQRDRLPWPNDSMDTITCMHLVEHLRERSLLLQEAARLLKPGGRLYLETPHPKSLALGSPRGKAAGTFTLNFYDDPTHIQVVSVGVLAQELQQLGLQVRASGISRNWLFALAYPLFLLRGPSRQKFTARIHWLGWSAYVAAAKPAAKA